MADITEHEAEEVSTANASGHTPVVFVHGLRLLPSSWDRWRTVFEAAGYSTISPGWPDDPNTVEEAKAHPELVPTLSLRTRSGENLLAADGEVFPGGAAFTVQKHPHRLKVYG